MQYRVEILYTEHLKVFNCLTCVAWMETFTIVVWSKVWKWIMLIWPGYSEINGFKQEKRGEKYNQREQETGDHFGVRCARWAMLLCDWRTSFPFPTAGERLISNAILPPSGDIELLRLSLSTPVDLWKTTFSKHKIKSWDHKRNNDVLVIS